MLLTKYQRKWCVVIGKTSIFAFRQGNGFLLNRLTYKTYVTEKQKAVDEVSTQMKKHSFGVLLFFCILLFMLWCFAAYEL